MTPAVGKAYREADGKVGFRGPAGVFLAFETRDWDMPGTVLSIAHSEPTLAAVPWTTLLLPPSYKEANGGMK